MYKYKFIYLYLWQLRVRGGAVAAHNVHAVGVGGSSPSFATKAEFQPKNQRKTQIMDKETLLTSIQAIIGKPDTDGNYGETGVSSRTLDTYLEGILPTLGDNPNEDLIKAHANILKSIGGQIRHEKAEFVKSRTQSAQTETERETEQADDHLQGIAKVLKGLQEDYKKMQERLDTQEKAKEQAALREKVIAGMRSKNATDEYVLKNAMRDVVFDAEKSVEQLVEESLKLYDAEFTEARGSGANPRQSASGAKSSDAELDDFFKEMKRKGKF